jgi:GT2 family glycosyltransferase
VQEKSAKGMNYKIAVIIVNWNGRKFLPDCLSSISNQTYQNYRIILIDNGSSDDSVNFVRSNFPNAEIIELEKNTGFAVANNIGIRKAFEDKDVKYIVPLNNDTKVDNNFLLELVRAYQELSTIQGEKVGSVAPKILKFHEDAKIDSAGILVYKDGSAINRGADEDDGERYNNSVEVFGPSACACLYSQEALEDVAYEKSQTVKGSNNKQYFDEDYFAYYEDVDLALRLRLRRWKSVYAPRAKVWHIHSATGISYSPFKSFLIHRNHYYNLLKNFPFWFLMRGLLFMSYRYWLLTRSTLEGKGPSARLKEKSNGFALVKIAFSSWYQVLINFSNLLNKRRLIQGKRNINNEEFGDLLRKFRADLNKMIFGGQHK